MESKVSFDFDCSSKPVIKAKISFTEDVRDKIAALFNEGFGTDSCLALAYRHPNETVVQTIIVESCDGWRNGSKRIAQQIPTIQMLNLIEAFTAELKDRQDVAHWKLIKERFDKENA